MDVIDLSRFQFASTSIFHFFFISLTVGLALLIAVMETVAYVRRDRRRAFDNMSNFFGHLFLINFAVGVVTGIVQEFQFGMNWSEYARFVGNIFGVPLALEVLMAFFLESTFIGLWWFGKDRLPRGVRLASIWLVAIGTQLSAFWIIVANGWMHRPVGYEIVNGQAVLTSFSEVVFNYKAWLYFLHAQGSCWTVAAFFVLAISAYHLLRAATPRCSRHSLRIALVFAAVGTVFSATSGHTRRAGGRARPADEVRRDGGAVGGLPESPAPWSPIAADQRAGAAQRRQPGDPLRRLAAGLQQPRGQATEGMNRLNEEYQQRYGPGELHPARDPGVLVVPDHGRDRHAAAAHRLRRAVPVVAQARGPERGARAGTCAPSSGCCPCPGSPTSSAGSPPRWAASPG